MDGSTNGVGINQVALPVQPSSELHSVANEMQASTPALLPSLPTVLSFDESDQNDGPHEGLLRLTQANTLLGQADMEEIEELLTDSLNEYVEVARGLCEGHSDKTAIVEGLPQAISVYMHFEEVLPPAIDLVRWFCSAHMICLEKLACEMATATARWKTPATGRGCPNEENGDTAQKALRILRLLIAGFRTFLDGARSRLFCSENHLKNLQHAVGYARETVRCIVEECSGPDPTVGKAVARLKGLLATSCFIRLHNAAFDNRIPSGTQQLFNWGNKDVGKLLKCIAQEEKIPNIAYLQLEGNCIEALGVLCSVAIAAPQVFAMIACGFADAIKCMNAASAGTWGRRPALQHITVRHTAIACAAHLADRLGKSPDGNRSDAARKLWTALSDCCIMQTGEYVCDALPAPGSAGAQAMAEIRSHSGVRSSSPRAFSDLTIAVPNRGDDVSKPDVSATEHRGWILGSVAEHTTSGNVATGNKRCRPAHSPREHPAGNNVADSRGANDQGVNGSTSPMNVKDENLTDNRGKSDPVDKSQLPPEPPRTMRHKRPRSLDEGPTQNRSTHDKGSLPPVLSRTMQSDQPEWRDGGHYKVVLGESFKRPGNHGSGGAVDESSNAGHCVHFKYDFIPGRTDVDATAMLTQRPLGGDEAENIARTGGTNEGLRWTAEMKYRSRHTENPGPVHFSGHASRAQDLECVLVFDGNMFVMDRVSVAGVLKYVQDVSALCGNVNKSAENATRKKEKPKKTDDKEKKERIKDATEKGEKKEKKKSTADKAGKNEKKNVVDDKATSGNQDKNNTRERKGPGKSSKAAENESTSTAHPPANILVAPANMLSRPRNSSSDNSTGNNRPPLGATEPS